MRKTIHLLSAILLAGVAAIGQEYTYVYRSPESTYTFKIVLRPGTTIGGHLFVADTIGSAVINDDGQIAFIARWSEYPRERNAIFTLHRIVVSEGEIIDGAAIASIPLYSRVAINAFATVAYAAFYPEFDAKSVFVERHCVFSPAFGPMPDISEFALSDKDDIVRATQSSGCARTAETLHEASPHCGPLSMMSANSRGQIVIVLNTERGPFLLVGTPTKH